MFLIDVLKAVFLGIVEGITEWLPISSTGHMILVNDFMNTATGFFGSQIFLYVIQLGAILAIITIYFKKLNPFAPSKTAQEKNDTWHMWFKVVVACLPAIVAGLLFNDYMESFSNPIVVSIMLIVYGIAFLVVEKLNHASKINEMNEMTYKTAFLIGLFQVLSIVPGTSRSGATILGAIIIGTSRGVAAEFSFFLAIPIMLGASVLKLATCDLPNTTEWLLLIISMATAYIVSMISVKFLVSYVRKHDFKLFAWYRIILGIILIAYFLFI